MTDYATFKYPVYNPCWQTFDVAADWGIYNTTQDINLALAQPFSVAAIRVLYTEPYIHNYDPNFPQIDLSRFDLVLLSDIEYYTQAEIEAWIAKQHIRNYVLAVGGINSLDRLQPNQLYRPYWIRHFLERNSTAHSNSADNKPYLFDALLGARRPHRDYVMMALDKTGLLERSIVTYRDCFPGAVINQQNTEFQHIFWDTPLQWPYVSPHLAPEWEVATQVNNLISFISPVELYRKTWYSIICETSGTGTNFFLSEKTIKAMFNSRMFVLFGPVGYLAKLREQGFETFRHVIDESYDSEPRDYKRFEMAMHQVMQLAWFENPAEMYREVQPVLEHNCNRLHELERKRQTDQREMLHCYISGEHWQW